MKKIALCCISKTEDVYIEEWIQYNKKLGFDRIFIYQNDWKTSVDDPILTKLVINGKGKQLPAYNHWIKTYSNSYDWCAFIDCDEFIVLKKHDDIHEFVDEFDNPYGIAINWQFYGSNEMLTRENNSVLKQFTRRQSDVNKHIKIILNCRSKGTMTLPHSSNKPSMDTNRKMINGPFNPNGPIDVSVINHYFHRTYEDWVEKCERGRSDTPLVIRPIDEWKRDKKLYHDVEDTTARDWFYGK